MSCPEAVIWYKLHPLTGLDGCLSFQRLLLPHRNRSIHGAPHLGARQHQLVQNHYYQLHSPRTSTPHDEVADKAAMSLGPGFSSVQSGPSIGWCFAALPGV